MAKEGSTGGSNMALWDKVRKTDPRMTRKVDDGRHKFTAIDAYYQIENATREWGPYGTTWGLFDTAINLELQGTTGLIIYTATFRFPGGEFPLMNSTKITTSKGGVIDDFAKKIETDTLTKALSRLGFNADIFLGLFDDNRYVEKRLQEETEKERAERKQKPKDPKPPEDEPADPLADSREEFLATISRLAKMVSAKAGKKIEGAYLIEHRLAGEPGWPPGMPGSWTTVDMYKAATKIAEEKIAATKQAMDAEGKK